MATTNEAVKAEVARAMVRLAEIMQEEIESGRANYMLFPYFLIHCAERFKAECGSVGNED